MICEHGGEAENGDSNRLSSGPRRLAQGQTESGSAAGAQLRAALSTTCTASDAQPITHDGPRAGLVHISRVGDRLAPAIVGCLRAHISQMLGCGVVIYVVDTTNRLTEVINQAVLPFE